MSVERIDTTWAAFFGLSVSAFLRPGIQVVAHHELGDYRGVWLFRHHASLCLSVPPALRRRVQDITSAWTMERLFGEAGIRALLGPRIDRIIGPAYQGYVEPLQFRPGSERGVRALSRSDGSILRQLADDCGGEAWEHSGIAFDEPNVFGSFVGDHLVAAARYRREWGETAHVGVVTHPAYRGRGHGRAVVSVATARGLEAGLIALYQTLLANAPSVALATALGYQRYATHLAVRLTDGAATDW